MYIHIDIDNSFASIHRSFDPSLNDVPVAVLSNNDGCAIARSNEVKALKIPMGAPYHKFEPLHRKDGVVWISGNHELYADMSARMVELFRREFSPFVEVYSIDECFLGMGGVKLEKLYDHGRAIKQRVWDVLILPVSVGIAPTKTLAKVATRYAKKNPEVKGVFALITEAEQIRVLATLALEDIWGVADKLAESLRAIGIINALELRNSDPDFLRKKFGVVMQRMCLELRGQSCLGLELVQADKKSIMCSRSFSSYITELRPMQEAVSTYACRAAEKMRAGRLVTDQLVVFLQTNHFNKEHKQYFPSQIVTFLEPTSDSRRIARGVLRGLHEIWQPGYKYKKAGVKFLNLYPQVGAQLNLFNPPKIEDERLMQAMDGLNHRFGRNKLILASAGTKKPWAMKSDFSSPCPTTRKEDIVTIYAK